MIRAIRYVAIGLSGSGTVEDEPQQKRPHLDDNDSSMARQSPSPPPDGNKLCFLLGVEAGAGQSALRSLDSVESSRAEDIFLCRLLETDDFQSSQNDGSIDYVKKALVSRQNSTRELMKLLEDAIDSRRAKIEDIAQILVGKTSIESFSDAFIQLCKLDDWVTEASRLNGVVDVIHVKHKHYADEIQTCINHSVDQLEIKHLADNELEEGKYVSVCRPCSLLNDQFQHWNIEVDRYITLMEPLQGIQCNSVYLALR
ncbi:hypothetical protein OROGR_024742 [Orobanche gracilis]